MELQPCQGRQGRCPHVDRQVTVRCDGCAARWPHDSPTVTMLWLVQGRTSAGVHYWGAMRVLRAPPERGRRRRSIDPRGIGAGCLDDAKDLRTGMVECRRCGRRLPFGPERVVTAVEAALAAGRDDVTV